MADDGENLVVVHGIHQTGVDAHAAVAAGKGIDRVGLIHLVVQVQIADVVELGHDTVQTLRIAVVGRQNGVLSVGFHHVLAAQLLDLCVADGQGLHCGATSIDSRIWSTIFKAEQLVIIMMTMAPSNANFFILNGFNIVLLFLLCKNNA